MIPRPDNISHPASRVTTKPTPYSTKREYTLYCRKVSLLNDYQPKNHCIQNVAPSCNFTPLSTLCPAFILPRHPGLLGNLGELGIQILEGTRTGVPLSSSLISYYPCATSSLQVMPICHDILSAKRTRKTPSIPSGVCTFTPQSKIPLTWIHRPNLHSPISNLTCCPVDKNLRSGESFKTCIHYPFKQLASTTSPLMPMILICYLILHKFQASKCDPLCELPSAFG